jgi:hypothetical protein
MERRAAQATALSVVLHSAVLATLVLFRPHAGEGPSRMSIIDAELVFDAGSWSWGATAAAEKDGATAARATPAPEGAEPTDSDEPATTATVADASAPAAAEQISETIPEPSNETAETEPSELAAAAGAPAETIAAVEPPQDEPAEREPSMPDTAEVAPPLEPSPGEPAGSNEVAAAADAAIAGDTPASAAAAAVPAVAESPPGVPLEDDERRMIATRFASWNGRFTPGEGIPSVDWKQNGQAYKAVFRAPASADPMGLDHVVVDVSTEQGGKRMSTQLTMTRLAFSNFAQFVDRWDPNVQIHDDVIDGRFHSNTPINVLSSGRTSPLFLGKVTIAAHDLETGAGGPFNRRKVFPEGVDTGVRRIVLPSRLLPLLNDAAAGAQQSFERDARITFYADGTYGWSYVEDGAPEERRVVTDPAHYLVGLDGATLRIQGTVNGKLLVYSTQRIVIENDLRYADPRGASDADDYLGLVAELDVEIAGPDVTGPGDLEIEASIYARRRFVVREFRSRPSGTLAIYGSVAAGSITATEPRFATKIEFDRRLMNARPPSFPLTDRYELESWNGQWRVEEPESFAAESDVAEQFDESFDDDFQERLGEDFAEAFDPAVAER